jgi:NAD kinase
MLEKLATLNISPELLENLLNDKQRPKMSVEYAIIIKNKTRLETLIERFNTKAQAKFYIERSGGDFNDYEKEHEIFHNSLSTVQRNLSTILKNKIVERSFLPSFIFNDKQVVVTVGQDGLVANTAKYVKQIPIVAVNPDQERYDGVLLPFNRNNFLVAVDKVITNTFNSKLTSFAEAKLNDGQRLLALMIYLLERLLTYQHVIN